MWAALVRRIFLIVSGVLLVYGCTKASRSSSDKSGVSGETLFSEYCSMCHPDGGNTLYPQKSLQKGTLAANGISSAEGIIDRMRNPGPRMKRFGVDEISDSDARKIALYIFETFK